MDIDTAIKMYYNHKTMKCPDNKTVPIIVHRRDNKLELKCKKWGLIITKPTYINIFEHLQYLLNNNQNDKYDRYVKKITDTEHNIELQEDKINKIVDNMQILFDTRKKYYNKIDPKLTSSEKKQYIKLYKKNKIINNDYLTWFDISLKYAKLQNELNIMYYNLNIFIKESFNKLLWFKETNGNVQESSSQKTGKKIKKIKLI
tara:strand:+ start:765 stop:1370 length:606 start_codon:yes stop_codon:yes gene_type:complete